MRLVLALSNPSFTRMRAVASINASTVARERCCEAFFRGFVSGLRAIFASLRTRVANASVRSYSDRAPGNCNAGSRIMAHGPYSQLIATKRWADRGLYDAVTQ